MYKGFEAVISLVQLENLRTLDSNKAKYQMKLVIQAALCCLEGLTKDVSSRKARGSH